MTEGESDRDIDCFLAVAILNFKSSLCSCFVAIIHEEDLSAVAQVWLIPVSTVLRLSWPCRVRLSVVKYLEGKGGGIKTLD